MARTPKADAPLTVERVERALDKLAETIVFLGSDGVKLLPLYDRVEAELNTIKTLEAKLQQIRDCASRSRP